MSPGVKFATLAQCPVLGGKVGLQIVVLDDLGAVVGDYTWAAKKGTRCARH